MYNDLIILTQLTQHSSGSSPHRHLHTSCFHSIWLICFPTSFSGLISALLLCLSSSLLLPCLLSHLSLPSVCLQVAFTPSSLVILKLLVFLPFFLHLCPLFLPTLWHSQVAMFPFSSLFFSAPPISRGPFSLPAGYCFSGLNSVMSLLLNILSRLVITFLPRSKRLLILWLQSPSAVILEPQKNKV